MLKHRIIPTLLWDGVQCVKPVSFGRPYRKLGAMEQYIQVMERRNIDELIIIDIEATPQRRKPHYDKLRRYCDNLYCPVTYGGGISTLDDIRMALDNGADKVCINSAFQYNWTLVNDAATKFGSQAIVVSIDIKDKIVYTKNGTFRIKYNFIAWLQNMEEQGAGEILLTDIQQDGTLSGYNYDLIRFCSDAVHIPIIANGGCGDPEHMVLAIKAGAQAVAAASIFLYTDVTPRDCAEYMLLNNIPVRLQENVNNPT